MNQRLRSMLGPLLGLALALSGAPAQAVEGAPATTVTVHVEPATEGNLSFARRVEVRARGAAALVRETDADAGVMLARMQRVWPLPDGRAVVAGEAVLGESTRTMQVWLIAVRDGRVTLLDELTLTVARAAPLGGVVETRGRVRVMVPAPAVARAEIEEWELVVHEQEADRERLRFRPLLHSREGVRAGRRIAWVDVDLTRDRFVTRASRRR